MALIRLNNQSISSVTALPSGIDTGKVLQVVTTTVTTTTSATSDSYVDVSGFTISITPSSSSSKVLVSWNILNGTDNGSSQQSVPMLKIVRGSTDIYEHAQQGMYANWQTSTDTITYLDSPATTSSITYKLQYKKIGGSGVIKFNSIYAQASGIGASTLALYEIAK